MTPLLDTLIRGGAMALLTFGALRFAAAGPPGQRRAIIVALNAGLGAYLYLSSPFLPAPPQPVALAIGAALALNPLLLWLAAVAFFDDDFILDWRAAAPVPFLLAPFIHPWGEGARLIAVIALGAHMIWVAARTAPGDLVAARIHFRRWFFIVAAALLVAIAIFEAGAGHNMTRSLAPAQALAFLLLAGAFMLWATTLRADLFPPGRAPPPSTPPADDPLAAALEAAMEAGAWRREGLTIGALAADLGAPEHRLRRLINQRLGHRNFAAFVNERRIAAACAALTDPAQAETQIIAIAHDVGFASLGPFNRAFRAQTGLSPTEYRRKNNPPPRQN